MQLFYHPNISEKDEQIIFPKEESRHIHKVLRKSEGDILKITNGKGLIIDAEIVKADLKQCLAKIISSEMSPEPGYHLHLLVAPTKMNDRYEWFLEKATEIGIHEITPVICEHSERKVVKFDRFERILQSALKQALHTRIPLLNEPLNFSEIITMDRFDDNKFIAHCEEGMEKKYLQELVAPKTEIVILIGPEGDFSLTEIEQALQNNWKPVSLGNSRLRTETAAIVACHTVALANEKV